MPESVIRGLKNRILQYMARNFPGGRTFRVMLHRARGVHIGENVWISYDVILETSKPHLITIEDGAFVGVRTTVIAHFWGTEGVKIEENAFVGPGVTILPNVVIGRGAVVTAGSVVTKSVPPMTLVQGNPAVAIAKCGVPLTNKITVKEFSRHLEPLRLVKPVPQGKN
jgi:acetyltransferase-like isoleucine patch superfamily enzyme